MFLQVLHALSDILDSFDLEILDYSIQSVSLTFVLKQQ
jgi:hypothetical protein